MPANWTADLSPAELAALNGTPAAAPKLKGQAARRIAQHKRGWCDALRAVGVDPESVPYAPPRKDLKP
jgi:hypothetical protein